MSAVPRNSTWAKTNWQTLNRPRTLNLAWVKAAFPYVPVFVALAGVLFSGVMVGVVQHKPAICYSFSAWYFGVLGVLYIAWMVFDRITARLK